MLDLTALTASPACVTPQASFITMSDFDELEWQQRGFKTTRLPATEPVRFGPYRPSEEVAAYRADLAAVSDRREFAQGMAQMTAKVLLTFASLSVEDRRDDSYRAEVASTLADFDRQVDAADTLEFLAHATGNQRKRAIARLRKQAGLA